MPSDSSSDEGFKLYLYSPSLAAAIIFAVLFTATIVRHCQILFRERTWSFVPFVLGCTCEDLRSSSWSESDPGTVEAIGYGARAYSATQTPDWELMPYIMQSIFILLGPALFAASIYMVLGRLIVFLEAQHHSPVRVKWLTKLFLLGDVLSFFGQGGGTWNGVVVIVVPNTSLGGGLLASASDKSTQDLGNVIIIGGLAIQVIFFSGFMVVTTMFHARIASRPTLKSKSSQAPWRGLIWVLYLASLLILVRSVFRMVEYAQGHDGALISKEVYVYLLDALLMFTVAAIFTLRHPSQVFGFESPGDTALLGPIPPESVPLGRYGRLDG